MGESLLEMMNRDADEAPPMGGRSHEADSPRSLTLAGVGGGPEELPEADDFAHLDRQREGGKLLSQSTLILLLLTVVAAGALYAMRAGRSVVTIDTDASVEAKIETALARFAQPGATPPAQLSSLVRNTEAVVAMFTQDHTGDQVPIEYLAKNPFRRHQNTAAQADQSQRQAEDAAARQRKALEREAQGLRLQTIMQGRVPVAIINDQLLQPGQKIGSFTIQSIQGLNVQLEAQGITITLTMQRDAGPTSSRGSFQR